MIGSHSPALSLANITSGFANTASTITTLTTSIDVAAGSLVAITCQLNAAAVSAGTITVTGSAGGFGTQTYSNFQGNGGDAGSHSLLVFTIPNAMPASTTITITRNTTWVNAEIRMILLTNCTRLSNFVTNTYITVSPSSINAVGLTFNSGTVSVLHFIPSSINITLGSSNSNVAIAGIGGGGNPGYSGAGMISVQGGSGTVNGTPGTGFRYFVATTIYPTGQVGPTGSQSFLWQNGATAQNWAVTNYRITPA